MKTRIIGHVLCLVLVASLGGACDADSKQGEGATVRVASALECDCSGHGTCAPDGTCLCDSGYSGPACEYSRLVTCNDHGNPDFMGRCSCDASFAGSTCSTCAPDRYSYPACTYCQASANCSGHGSCDTNGLCVCSGGFAGASCNTCQPDHYGPNCLGCTRAGTCNDHGNCNTATGGCVCDPGYTGAACGSGSDFIIFLNTATLAVAYHGSATITVGTAVTSGAAQSVAFSIAGLPSGATASFAPSSVTSGQASTLTIDTGTAPSTPSGVFTLIVTGTAASGSRNAGLLLVIAEPTAGETALDVCRASLASCEAGGSTGSAALAACQAQNAAAAQSIALCEAGAQQAQASYGACSASLASCSASQAACSASQAACSASLATCSASQAACSASLAVCQAGQGDADGDGIPDRFDRCASTKTGDAVDPTGCSLDQFCAKVDVSNIAGIATCAVVDWQNDEPIGAFDCRVILDHGRKTCVPIR